MTSSTDILDVITSNERLWPLFLTIIPNTDMNIRLDLSEDHSLNINKKVTVEELV